MSVEGNTVGSKHQGATRHGMDVRLETALEQPKSSDYSLEPAPIWKDWDSAEAVKMIGRAIAGSWKIRPDLREEMPEILAKIITKSTDMRAVAAAAKIVATLDRNDMERARLALDVEKFKTLSEMGITDGVAGNVLEIEITRVKTRLRELNDPSLGRPLVPGLGVFCPSMKTVEAEVVK